MKLVQNYSCFIWKNRLKNSSFLKLSVWQLLREFLEVRKNLIKSQIFELRKLVKKLAKLETAETTNDLQGLRWDYNRPFIHKIKCELLNLSVIQTALVIRGLFICKFAYSHWRYGSKWHFSSKKWTFYLRIQDPRSKMTEHVPRITREASAYLVTTPMSILTLFVLNLVFYSFLKLIKSVTAFLYIL